jgi:hypothetical protein
MKKVSIITAIALLFAAFLVTRLLAADIPPSPIHEYITIRWAGRENTHIIRPGGKVEFVGSELRKVVRPDRTDDRSFYMNVVMNGLSKEGYEFAGMTTDEIVMKRLLSR